MDTESSSTETSASDSDPVFVENKAITYPRRDNEAVMIKGELMRDLYKRTSLDTRSPQT